jgi:Sialic acid synthase
MTGFRSYLPPLPGRPAPSRRSFVIGEVAQAHDGSLGMAHAFIDAIAAAGADAVKFQTHIAEAESTPAEPWRVKFSPRDETRFEYWKRMEFTEPEWAGLRRHADAAGLYFLSSPFSVEAVELLSRIGVAAWKVASGELTNPLVLEPIAALGQPVMLSTGMNFLEEIDAAVGQLRARNVPLAVLQCTSAYPCQPEQVGINMIAELQARYECPVGLSDHSGAIFPSLAAAALGAEIFEMHVTLSREMFGPDVSASLTTAELKQMVDGVRFIDAMMASPVDKDTMADSLLPVRATFTKSLVARTDLAGGTVLLAEHLSARKPGTGIPASRLGAIIGSRLRRDIPADTMLAESDLDVEARDAPQGLRRRDRAAELQPDPKRPGRDRGAP